MPTEYRKARNDHGERVQQQSDLQIGPGRGDESHPCKSSRDKFLSEYHVCFVKPPRSVSQNAPDTPTSPPSVADRIGVSRNCDLVPEFRTVWPGLNCNRKSSTT